MSRTCGYNWSFFWVIFRFFIIIIFLFFLFALKFNKLWFQFFGLETNQWKVPLLVNSPTFGREMRFRNASEHVELLQFCLSRESFLITDLTISSNAISLPCLLRLGRAEKQPDELKSATNLDRHWHVIQQNVSILILGWNLWMPESAREVRW